MISNCGHDENGKGRNGQAGDQTSTEYCVRTWWDDKWDCVLRHPDSNVRAKIAELATNAANNNMIGYDQNQRLTFYNELKKVNWQPQNIKTPCESDCSASTSAVIIATGYILGVEALKNVSPSLTTFIMKKALINAGFKCLEASTYLRSQDYLLPGDILLNQKSHVAINLTAGAKAVENTHPVTPVGDTYTVVKDDTLSKIGEKLGIDWKQIAAINGITEPYVIHIGQVLKLNGTSNISTNITYTVQKGDTLSKIGANLGLDWKSIANINNIPAPYVIHIGQVLKLDGATQNNSYKVKVIAKRGLNVRTAPVNGKVLLALPYGTEVTVTKEANGWGYINHGGKSGWICLEYMSRV